MKATDEYTRLMAAVEAHGAPCEGFEAFTSDHPTPPEIAMCKRICDRCPVKALCNDYALKAKPEAGIWAGRVRATRKGKDDA